MDFKPNFEKILIFKLGLIGDILMTTPLIREIRTNFPESEIIYYIGDENAFSVLKGNKNIDRVEVFDNYLLFLKDILKLFLLLIKIRKEQFDIAFILDKHWAFGLFIKLCGIPIRVGFDRDGGGIFNTCNIRYHEAKHEILYYLSLLESIGIKPKIDTQMDLFIDKKEINLANKFFKKNKLQDKIIGIFASDGDIKSERSNPLKESRDIRKYPPNKWIELIQKLSKKYKIILFGGPRDKEFNQKMINFLKNKNIINGTCSTIQETAAIMGKCSLIITTDMGPMHLASAVNNKIISLFGPTNPARKAPLHKESIAIWKDQDIYDENFELYGRQPNKNKKNRWMKRITVREIEEAVKRYLS